MILIIIAKNRVSIYIDIVGRFRCKLGLSDMLKS